MSFDFLRRLNLVFLIGIDLLTSTVVSFDSAFMSWIELSLLSFLMDSLYDSIPFNSTGVKGFERT